MSSGNRGGGVLVALFGLLVGFIGIVGIAAMSNDIADAKRAIETQGYREVQAVERHWFGSSVIYGCSDDDAYAFSASAINANNQRVNIVACSGYFSKGFTIRTK